MSSRLIIEAACAEAPRRRRFSKDRTNERLAERESVAAAPAVARYRLLKSAIFELIGPCPLDCRSLASDIVRQFPRPDRGPPRTRTRESRLADGEEGRAVESGGPGPRPPRIATASGALRTQEP